VTKSMFFMFLFPYGLYVTIVTQHL